MKTSLLFAVSLGCLVACKPTADPGGQTKLEPVQEAHPEMTSLTVEEPAAEKRPHELTQHGHTRQDEYFWLRDDTRKDPAMLAYLEAENAWFEQRMEPTAALQETLFEEMTGRLDPDESGVPYRVDDYWYYYRYEAGQEYPIYARRQGSMDAAEEILVDGNRRAKGQGYYSLSGFAVSDDHRYVAIAEDKVGRRIHEIRVLDTHSGEFLPELISKASNSLAWSADGDYLYYLNKHPETLLAYQVMRHKLGSGSDEDVMVYEEADNTFYSGIERSRSGEFIMLMHGNTDTTEVQLLAANDPLGSFRPFLPREPGHEYAIDHAGGKFFIRSNWNAENFRVLSATLDEAGDKDRWTEVIPHREDALVQTIQAFDNWLLIGERVDGLRKVRVRSHDGSTDRYVDTGEAAYVMWPYFNVSTHSDLIRYGFSSLATPDQVWEIDLKSGESKLLKADRVLGDFSSDNYQTRRIIIAARDGTRVPASLAFHRNTKLDGSAPTLIYGYGSYGYSTDPIFRNAIISLLDRGFIFVIAHVRGGQEMGRKWYDDGRLMNKMNTFTDFIDVTRGLQQKGMIDAQRTYAMGGSAGGLLMGAVINMAPELYHGVIAAVPFVDVVTGMLDESIPLTTGEFKEWGNPAEKEAYDYMLSYSPYDQVREQDYPNLMVTTGLHDSQVQYYDPAKWVARLRDRRTDKNRLIFHINMEAGHGGASGRYRRYRETAQEYAFLVDLAGLER
jgi:oligopeptidase B